MLAEFDKRKTPGELLQRMLVASLQTSRVVCWPGADGLTEDDILSYYPQAIAAGDVPGWLELQDRFPGLETELHALRLTKGWLDSPADRDNKRITPRHIESLFTHCPGASVMQTKSDVPMQETAGADQIRLSRWLVSYSSAGGWYSVGEFIAHDAATAIERAVAVFGAGAAYQAEELPWDAAPLSKANRAAVQN